MLEKKLKIIGSFAIASFVSILFITFATVFGELNKPFKDWLTIAFGHHWAGKGALSVIIFFAVAGLHWLTAIGMHPVAIDRKVRKLLVALFVVTILSSLIIIGFFTLHFMKMF